MKKLCSSLLFLFATLTLTSQSVKLDWSNEIENPNKATPSELLFKNENELYALSYYRKNIFASTKTFFEVYNSDKGKLITSKEFEFKRGKEEYNIAKYILQNDKILLLATISDKEKYQIFYNYCDLKGKLLGKWNDLETIKKDTKRDKYSVRFFYSEKNQKLFIFKPEFGKKQDKERYLLIAYDKDLNQLYKKKIILPYAEDIFSLSNLFIDSNDRAFIQGSIDRKKEDKVSTEDSKKSKGKKKTEVEDADESDIDIDDENAKTEKKKSKKGDKDSKSKDDKVQRYVPVLMTFDFAKADSVEAREFKFDLDKKFVLDFNYKILKDGSVLVVGLYANNSKSYANGVFASKIDLKNMDNPLVKLEKFDTKFVNRMIGSDKEKRTKNGVPYITINNIHIFDDGTFIVDGDDYHVYQVCTTDSRGNTRCSWHYVSNDIFNIKFNADCSVEWFTYLPKYHHTVNDNGIFSRYSTLKKGDKIYYVFNDNPKNLEPPKKKKNKPTPYFEHTSKNISKDMIPVCVILDKSGEFEKEALAGPGGEDKSKGKKGSSKSKGKELSKDAKKANKKYKFIPRLAYSINEDEMIAISPKMTLGKSGYRLVKLKVEE